MKIALISHFSAGSDIKTNVFQFINFGEIEIFSKKSFITSTTGQDLERSDGDRVQVGA